MGEALQAPILAGVGPAFFGMSTLADFAKLQHPGTLFDKPEYTKWHVLRGQDTARWLGVATNRFLLRLPHTATAGKGFGVNEEILGPTDYLWGNPAWIVATLVAKAFATTGWPTDFTGTKNGTLAEMPLRPLERGNPNSTQIALEALLPDAHADDLAATGILTLMAQPNLDAVTLLRGPSANKPARGKTDLETTANRLMSALAYQMLAARLGDMLVNNKARLATGKPAEIEGRFEQFISGLLASTGAGAGVAAQVQPDKTDPNRQVLIVRAKTGKNVLTGVELNFAFRL